MNAAHGSKDTVAEVLEGAGAGLALIGAYSPWVVTFALFTSVPVRGIHTDYGRLLPLIPLTVLGLLAWHWYARGTRWVHVVVTALGIVTILLVVSSAVQMKRNLTRARESMARSGQMPGAVNVRFDLGIYLSALGGVAMISGGVLGTNQQRSRIQE